jgi:restriction system protein
MNTESNPFEDFRPPNPYFTGRKEQLRLLERESRPFRHGQVVKIIGPAGIGKTELAKQFFFRSQERERRRMEPIWVSMRSRPDVEAFERHYRSMLDTWRSLGREYFDQGVVVVIDGADEMLDETGERLEGLVMRAVNFKATRAVLVTSRSEPRVRGESIILPPFDASETEDYVIKRFRESRREIPNLSELFRLSKGIPVVLAALVDLLVRHSESDVLANVAGQTFEISKDEESRIIKATRPGIIEFSDTLADRVKKNPEQVHNITSRQFEELVAELFDDMGWEVELTKATRDGGRDILARLNTGVMKMLCLIETKRYRKDRPVGISLVKNLWGTLCDEHANSGMLVTTSYFSPDAKKFQQKYEYQLALKDYSDIAEWLMSYKDEKRIIRS